MNRISTTKGLAAGLAGGLAASWVMERFQASAGRIREKWQDEAQDALSGGPGRPPAPPPQSEEEPATVKMATAVAEKVFHRQLEEREKAPAAEAVHYFYGALAGGIYGMAAEHSATVRYASGTLFAAVLWLVGDEIAVPALHLAKGPAEYSVGTHLFALASHVVYGTALETVRRAMRTGLLP